MTPKRNTRTGYDIFINLVFFSFSATNHCHATTLLMFHNITRSQPLSQPNTLVSPKNTFELGFFTPNGSLHRYVGIWYKGVLPQTVVWVANRDVPLALTDSQASLAISPHGILEVLDGDNRSVWSSSGAKAPSGSSVVRLLDSGNLVVTDASSGESLWQSFDRPADTFLPGARLGFNSRTGERYELRSWRNESDPSPGGFLVEISTNKRPPEALIRSAVDGGTRWRSGPWDKTKYTGLPDMETFYDSQYDLVQDAEKGTTFMTFNSFENSNVRYFYLTPQGAVRLMEKHDDDGKFYVNWDVPTSLCDFYGVCGTFAVCKNYTSSPMCECLKGFIPKSSQEWRTRNWTRGCVRRTELATCSAGNGSSGKADGFWKVGDVKPPDFYEFVELVKPSADHCRKACLGNCTCLAYAYIQGIGCLAWSRSLIDLQGFSYAASEIFYRVSHQELDRVRRMKIILIIVVVLGCGIIGATMHVLYKRQTRRHERGNDVKDVSEITKLFELAEPSDNTRQYNLRLLKQHNPTELPVFDFGAILIATDHFSLANKVGQGGFGSVYKGRMPDGKQIAVKRLSSSSGQGIIEFENEMVLISRLQHRNLVRLFGYCIENEEKLLIYEYMPNNSLDHFIFNSSRCARLDWAMRLNIILGISKGLAYLHRDSCLRVVHRDLKASNILLDNKMNPKISDFGLARMFQGTMDLTNTRRVVGTLGYMSPEYAIAGIFSEKSDVFSFGVLLLEILSGTKNTSFYDYEDHLTLIAYAWKLWNEDKGLDMVDKALGCSYSPAEVMRCLNVALLCVQDNAIDRPTMTDVVFMLSNETTDHCTKPKQPLFSFQISTGCDLQKPNNITNRMK